MVEVYACTYNIDYIYSSIDPANIVGIQDHAIVASSRSIYCMTVPSMQ